MFEIIKNAELPESNRGKTTSYPFAQMEVGDGFDAPRDMGTGNHSNDKRQGAIGASARTWSKKYNPSAKFTVRLLDKNTVRCVRIA